MKFIVDAQLPRSLSDLLNQKGHSSVHTLELPLQNATPDHFISSLSESEKRVVITKDTDFLQSHIIKSVPRKLILVRTGNIHNATLLQLFDKNLLRIIELLSNRSLIEITATEIISHG